MRTSNEKLRFVDEEEQSSLSAANDDSSLSWGGKKIDNKLFKDDTSLCLPSSTIRFRANKSTARVYPDERGQFIIEEKFVIDDDGKKRRVANAKFVETSTYKILLLRATYTLVALFFTGFLLVLAMELLLYLVMDLTIEAGYTNKGEVHPLSALGVFLALPLFIYGLASALVLSWFFVTDAWNGHLLIKQFGFGNRAVVIVDWFTFFLYFGIPILTLIGTILGRKTNWWEITSLVWFTCVSISFAAFSAIVIYYECRANWEVTRNRYDNDDDRWFHLISRAILLRQRNLFGGEERSTYLLRGSMEDASTGFKGGHRNSMVTSDNITKGKTLYCKIISWKIWQCLGMFVPVEGPSQRQYTLNDVQNSRAFLTSHTWSLENVFCRDRYSRYVVVLGGKQALTKAQMNSSVWCALLGNLIGILLLVAFLVWLGAPLLVRIVVLILVIGLFLYPSMAQSFRIMKMMKNVFGIFKSYEYFSKMRAVTGSANTKQLEDNASSLEDKESEGMLNNTERDAFTLEQDESEGMFQVWESHRVITLTSWFCWVIFALEVIFLFLYPLVAIINIGNQLTSIIFVLISLSSFVRTYFNAAIVVEETGRMDLVDGQEGSLFHWQNMSRLNTITTKITRSPGKTVWSSILIILLLMFTGLGGMTITSEASKGGTEFFTYAHGFEYEQQNDVPYPTCAASSINNNKAHHQMRSLADYTFLASLAYVNNNITQIELDAWFGKDENGKSKAVFNETAVEDFRKSELGSTKETPVVYKLIKFPQEKEGVVTIRGSTDPVDFMVDGQLWMGAALFQVLRYFMPIGNMWTPIIHHLIEGINLLESESIQKIAFYKETTKFIQWLQRSGEYNNIQTTGHSLGGGLAMISGAQTGVAGIGVSAPNTMLSRVAFNLTVEDLNTKTFNIIPERDVVPMVDDLAQNYQHVRCTANSGHFSKDTVECHGNGRRTLCELLYTCGTQNRPALCECVTDYEYPEPKPKDGNATLSFKKQCELIKKMNL